MQNYLVYLAFVVGVVGLVLGALAYDKVTNRRVSNIITLKSGSGNRTAAATTYSNNDITITFDGKVQFADTNDKTVLVRSFKGGGFEVHVEGIYPVDGKLGFVIKEPHPYTQMEGYKLPPINVYEYTSTSSQACGEEYVQVGATTYIRGNKVGYYTPVYSKTGGIITFTSFGNCTLSASSMYGTDNKPIVI